LRNGSKSRTLVAIYNARPAPCPAIPMRDTIDRHIINAPSDGGARSVG
jgi:hypothetical protein